MVDIEPAGLGEGPAWDGARLLWVDVFAGLVHAADESGTRKHTWRVGRHVSAALPGCGDEVLLVAREGFALLSGDGSVTPVLDVLGDVSDLRFNDAKCDPVGRALAGTMAYDSRPGAGSLYRLDNGPVATVMLPDRTVSNGMAWSPDGDRIYYIDTLDHRIAVFAYYPLSRAPLGKVLSVIDVPFIDGNPDGMCVDDEGALWVALWDGSSVRRYTPDGRLDTVVDLPVKRPTSCCFGGASGDTLFITSAYRGLATPSALDGCLFAVRPGVTGRPATPWRRVAGV